MSGPLDRPSFPEPDDLDRPTQDRESASQDANPAEPWPATDPWQESKREPPGWDDWPPAVPPPDDYYVEPGPSQDLWTESWDDEAASTLPRSGYEPASYEPAPFEPEPYEPPPYPPRTDASSDASSDDAAPIASESAAEPAPVAEEPVEGPVEDAFDVRPPEPLPAPVLPDWLAEPVPESPTQPSPPSPTVDEGWDEPEADGPEVDEPGVLDAPVIEPAIEPELPSWLDVGPVTAPPAFLDVHVDADLEAPPVAEPHPIRPDPAPEPEPEPAFEASVEAPAAEEPAAAEPWSQWEEGGGTVEADLDGEPESEPPFDGSPAQVADLAPEIDLAPDLAPETVFDADSEPEPAIAADVEEPEPAAWTDLDESTRVLPTSWTPPPPVEEEPAPELEPTAGEVRTSLGERTDEDVEPDLDSSTAEQAVPWLIGLILLLAGMVIVLLALIFAGDQSLGGPSAEASPTVAGVLPSPTAVASPTPVATASPTAAPTPTPIPAPEYGPLEMVYQGRSAALAPIYLLVHDFTTEDEEVVLAQDPTIDVRRFAWAPDGTVGAGLLADVLVSIEPGESKRNLGEGLITVTFGGDTSMVYAVRITADGTDDVATVLAIDFASGDASELASVTYPRPTIGSEPALPEAQFTDDGGTIRLFWMNDGTLRLWALGASTWQIDPESGDVTDLEGDELPILVDADNTHRIALDPADDSSTTTIRYLNTDGDELATTTAPGLVSHLRWSRGGDRVVFTVGRSAGGGGVLQDLFLWDLEAGVQPTQITNTGAAFGAEWRGTLPRWEAS